VRGSSGRVRIAAGSLKVFGTRAKWRRAEEGGRDRVMGCSRRLCTQLFEGVLTNSRRRRTERKKRRGAFSRHARAGSPMRVRIGHRTSYVSLRKFIRDSFSSGHSACRPSKKNRSLHRSSPRAPDHVSYRDAQFTFEKMIKREHSLRPGAARLLVDSVISLKAF